MGPVRRRQFLIASGALFAAPIVGGQQPGKVYRIGFLFSGTPMTAAPALDAFKDALRALGWVEGRNIVIERRYAEGDQSRMPSLARELVSQGVDIILPNTTPGTLAANEATRTIPIVMVGTLDAQLSGVVKDLARPGGNITGLTLISVQLLGKRLSLLKEAVPTATRLGFLTARRGDSGSTWAKTWDLLTRTMETEARRLGMELHTIAAFGAEEIKASFAGFEAARVNALYVIEGSLAVHRVLIADLALKARLPTVFGVPTYVEAGGLLSYGADTADLNRRAASFVDKILKGAKPGDLPVEQPTRYELVINLKTAKALGLKIPQAILLRADRVIE